MKYKNTYNIILIISLSIIGFFLLVFLKPNLLFTEKITSIFLFKIFNLENIYNIIKRHHSIYRVPLITCFILNIIFFIIFGILSVDGNQYSFKKNFNITIIGIITVLFIICLLFEQLNPNFYILKNIIKPISDFFGFLVIESDVNKILNNKLNYVKNNNNYKVFNNWKKLVNLLKRRIKDSDIFKLTDNNFDFGNFKDSQDFLYFNDIDQSSEIRKEFADILNLKDDTGYIVLMIVIIIVLYNIR